MQLIGFANAFLDLYCMHSLVLNLKGSTKPVPLAQRVLDIFVPGKKPVQTRKPHDRKV